MGEKPKFQIPEVRPSSNGVPLPSVEEASAWSRIRISELDDEKPQSRTRRDGSTRLNVGASDQFLEVGRRRFADTFFEWMAVDENRESGLWSLVPTDKDDLDRIPVRWIENGHICAFTLRKVLLKKGIEVAKGYTMVVDCSIGPAKDDLPGLLLNFPARTTERVVQRGGRRPAPPKPPTPPDAGSAR